MGRSEAWSAAAACAGGRNPTVPEGRRPRASWAAARAAAPSRGGRLQLAEFLPWQQNRWVDCDDEPPTPPPGLTAADAALATTGPHWGLDAGIGDARSGLEAAIRGLLAPHGMKQAECQSQGQAVAGPRASARGPLGCATLPMYVNANSTPNYQSRPDDAIAELLCLKSRLADRLGEKQDLTSGRQQCEPLLGALGLGRPRMQAKQHLAHNAGNQRHL